MEKNRIKELLTLNQTKFLNFYKATYENRMGERKEWFIATRKKDSVIRKQYFEGKEDTVDAVLVLATHEESGKLVLIKQFRVPLNDYIYELPAGLIDEGESYEMSVGRELKEETGLELTVIEKEKSREKLYLSPGMTDESIALVYCKCRGELSKAYMEADEDIEPMLVSKEEAKEILSSGAKIDIKAFMALQHYVQSV